MKMKLSATYLRDGRWAVRPEGALGTCGWHTVCVQGTKVSVPWTVAYMKAYSAEEAIRKVERLPK